MRASIVLPVCMALLLVALPASAASPVASRVPIDALTQDAMLLTPGHARSRFLHVQATGPVRINVDVQAGAHVGLTLRSSGLCRSVALDDGASAGILLGALGEHFALDCGSLPAGWYQVWVTVAAGAALVQVSSPTTPVTSTLGEPAA